MGQLTAADKREIAALCGRRNELRRRGQFVGDSASEDQREDRLQALLSEDLKLRRRMTGDAAAPPVKAAAPNGARAVYYVQELVKIMIAILSDPVLRPIIEQQLKTAGASPAHAVVGSEQLPPPEVPTPGNPSGEGTERLLPSSVGDSAAPRDKLASLLPGAGKRRERETINTALKNIFTRKGR
jgi:hypothetical protein